MPCKSGIAIFILLFLAGNLYGYQTSTEKLGKVKLKDGTVYKTSILAIDIDHNVTIGLPDSQQVTISNEHVYKIKGPGIRHYGDLVSKKGFMGSVSFGLLFGKSSESAGMRAGVAINGMFGYQFTELIGVGVGAGAEFVNELITAPIFVRLDGQMIKARVAPIYTVDLGGSLAWYNDNGFNDFNNVSGGWLFRPGLGFRFKNLNNSLYFLVSYQIQSVKYESNSGWWEDYQSIEARTMKNLNYTFGIKF